MIIQVYRNKISGKWLHVFINSLARESPITWDMPWIVDLSPVLLTDFLCEHIKGWLEHTHYHAPHSIRLPPPPAQPQGVPTCILTGLLTEGCAQYIYTLITDFLTSNPREHNSGWLEHTQYHPPHSVRLLPPQNSLRVSSPVFSQAFSSFWQRVVASSDSSSHKSLIPQICGGEGRHVQVKKRTTG